MFTLEPAKKMRYIQCNRGGFHDGQLLNMVCLEPGCLNNPICCCACIQEYHSKHQTMSIKKMLADIHEKTSKVSGTNRNINSDILNNMLEVNKKQAMQKFIVYKNTIRQNIVLVQNIIKSYYNNIYSQLGNQSKSDYSAAMQVLGGNYNIQELNQWMKKLIVHAVSSQTLQPVTQNDLINTIQNGHKSVMSGVVQKVNDMGKQLQLMAQKLKTEANQINIWQPPRGYVFTSQWKASDVKILNQTTVKSCSSNSYKFAVMNPDIENGDFKQFKFRIKKKESSWIAVGMCHRDIVKKNNFKFQYSAIGHGAYMVSSNSGSWSNKQGEKNNKVMAFDFGTGDIITVQVNFSTKKIKFLKNQNAATYELEFFTIAGQKLYPCCLFYFNNDEIQFVPKS